MFFAYDVAGVIVPYFANRLNTPRLYQITLFFLSPPYLIIGANALSRIFYNLYKNMVSSNTISNNYEVKILSVLLVIYFLFNSGVVLTIFHDPYPPMWLNRYQSPSWSTKEIIGAKWIKHYEIQNSITYLGNFKFPLFSGLGIKTKWFGFKKSIVVQDFPETQEYVYLGKETTLHKEIESFYFGAGGIPIHEFISLYQTDLWKQLYNFNKIYANPHVSIYCQR
ncbi:DUF2206 domain-containing protein [Thermococcus peptonophilus]|uniref:DUF2206 domain-containing protein n=1 Tax=Thermococcus peptonophilus TaxID=53952 RepID=UPI0006D05981